jgi:NAD(P)-dependent dehydrogenase (short-subunit alcohol dehydrogenase family)
MINPTTSRFDARSTAAEVIDGVDLRGKRAIVTGGASGIGLETARALASAGAEVTLAVRSPDSAAATAAAEALRAAGGAVHLARLDLTDLSTVTAFTESSHGPLDILVNNAGVMAVPQLVRTEQGWESQYAANHLGHAALALGLHDALAASGPRDEPSARIVQVASSAHLMAPFDFDDPHFERRPYEAWTAYAQSKTAMILFTVALAKRWAHDGITANTLHPGGIMTNLQRHLDDAQLAFVGAKDADGTTLDVPPGWKTPQQGAATSVLLAASPIVTGVTGRYFEDCAPAPVQPNPTPRATGVAPYAIDPALADRLWDLTIAQVGR